MLAEHFGEPDVRVFEQLPWPIVREWLAHFKLSADERERDQAKRKAEREAEEAVRGMKHDPYFRRRR